MTERRTVVSGNTIGDAWLDIAGVIVQSGTASFYDGLAMREVLEASLVIAAPDPDDAIIDRFGDAERVAWMHANFTDHAAVPELGHADSYATCLYDYAHTGLDQVAWVIDRLRTDPLSRSATITTFQPLIDTTYIPCVSLLDFYLHEGALCQVATCHSIDFGAKGYGNLIELAALSARVARDLGCGVGHLTMNVKSAHIYDAEVAYVENILRQR